MNQYPNNFNYPGNQNNQNNQYYQYNQYPPYPNGYYPPNHQYNAEMQERLRINMLRRKERNAIIADGFIIGATIIAMIVVEFIVVLMLQKSDAYAVYNSSSTFQNFFNVIAVHLLSLAVPFSLMALILKKRFTTPLIPTKKIGAAKTAAWVAVGMGVCMAANFITNGVIKLFDIFGYKLTQPELIKPDSIIALISVFISTSLVPAIFEEYAFRCCTLGVLRRYGKGFAVVAVSIVFGLIHQNVIQFVFAFLVGLILGYVTVVTDSVIPAMIIHGINNGISVLGDVVTYFSKSDKLANTVEGYVIMAFIALSIAGLIYLIVNRELLPKKEEIKEEKPYKISFGVKLACLLPGFAIPFLILIAFTSQFIQKK